VPVPPRFPAYIPSTVPAAYSSTFCEELILHSTKILKLQIDWFVTGVSMAAMLFTFGSYGRYILVIRHYRYTLLVSVKISIANITLPAESVVSSTNGRGDNT
jgi:hypothetical protein